MLRAVNVCELMCAAVKQVHMQVKGSGKEMEKMETLIRRK
jgi:hypothetical protein